MFDAQEEARKFLADREPKHSLLIRLIVIGAYGVFALLGLLLLMTIFVVGRAIYVIHPIALIPFSLIVIYMLVGAACVYTWELGKKNAQ